MLLKAHLTSDSGVSDSRWVITSSWLSGPVRFFFLYSSFYSCHLFLIYSASVRSIWFLSFFVPIFAWNFSLVSLIFLKRSLVFPILWFSSISLHCSLQKALYSLLVILWNCIQMAKFSFPPLPFTSLLVSAICKVSSGNHLGFFHFFFLGWFWSPPPVQCYKPPSIIL